MMNPELKAKWIADLKTHTQATGVLHDAKTGGYCCLGVACLTLGAAFGGPGDIWGKTPRLGDLAINDGEGLSKYGVELLGITELEQDQLIHINDTSDSFEPVIGWIEANL